MGNRVSRPIPPEKKIRLLLVEDSPADAELMVANLRAAGFDLEWQRAETAAEFEAALATRPDAVLADYSLPQFGALAALQIVREKAIDVPVIVVSGSIGEERAIECIRAGAADYLLKDRLARLGHIVTAVLEQRELRRRSRAAEEDLRKSERHYRQLFDSNPAPMWVFDRETLQFLAVNDAAVAHYGYSRDEFLGMTLRELRPGAEIERRQNHLSRPIAHEPEVWRHLKKDGTEILVEIVGNDLPFACREARLVMATDVTEKKRAEVQLRLQATMLEVAANPVIVTDVEGRITWVNPAFTALTGYTAEEAIGQTPRLLKSGQHEAEFYRAMWETLRAGRVWRGDVVNRRKDGALIFDLHTITPLRNEAGAITHFMAVMHDETEKKKLESELFRAQRVEGIGRLSSGIAHDMNNILAPIMMSAPLLRMKLPPREFESTLATIEKSAQRGADLVRQLLIFSRGVEGERGPVRVRDLIEEMAKIARETFPRTITIMTDCPRDIWPVRGDATQLHQVLLNLCVNARDAMLEGGTLVVTATNVHYSAPLALANPEAKPGPHVVLRVADSGCGIPPEIREAIFDPFFTTKELGKGTGLGLSTVHGIVKSHGGFVTLTSEVGQGTTFEICLPAMQGATSEAAPAESKGIARGEQELILVVDDEESIRRILRQTLERYNYRVITANDGADAALAFARHRDDVRLILTDVDMPFMDGPNLVRVVRKMSPGVKFILSSGLAGGTTLQDKADALADQGVHTVLSKPYTAHSILAAVQQELKRT